MKKNYLKCLMQILLFSGLVHGLAAQKNNSSQTQPPIVYCDHYNFSDTDKDASNWSALYIASNHKIYVGLSTHADAANIYEFDIDSKTMRQLANLTLLLDERGKAVWTNGKIHVKMQELDGYVYLSSFCEDNGPPVFDANSYQGPFWFRIRMSDGQVEVLDKINSFWGNVGQAIDKKRKILYGLAENGHLYRYFIEENYTEDLGRVDNWDICRTIFVDDIGNVYGSYPPGNIWKFDVEKDRIFDLEYTKLPISIDARSMANPMLDRRAQWRIIEWDPLDKVAYGIIGGNNTLFRYDVHNGEEGEVTPLAKLCAPAYRTGRPFDIPHATLAMTISPIERKIYYIPVTSGDFDYGSLGEEIRSRSPSQSFLTSYDLETGEVEDLGIIRGKDSRRAYGMGAAETDRNGKIWFVGAFEEPDEKYVARKRSGWFPYSMGLGCYDPFEK